jgi:hypothetical protein
MTAPQAPATPPAPDAVAPRAGGPLLALLGSEVSRVSHRLLFRILAILFIGGILVASIIAFFAHAKTAPGIQVSPGDFAYSGKPPYRAAELFAPVSLSVLVGLSLLGFVMGASAGGADWSSRSMALQLLWEPRRLRLLLMKWLGVVIDVVLLGVVSLAFALALASITASLRGTWHGMDASAWHDVWSWSLRGFVLAIITVTLGYAISVLVRNTGASLGVAFVYFAIVESAASVVLAKYEPFRVLLGPNIAAWLSPGGVDFPGAEHTAPDGSITSHMVHLSSLHGVSVLLGYVLLLGIPAIWSFTRRDVA